MKSKLTLNNHRPRIERHGKALVITVTDDTGSTVEINTDLSVGYCVANDINEIIQNYRNENGVEVIDNHK